MRVAAGKFFRVHLIMIVTILLHIVLAINIIPKTMLGTLENHCTGPNYVLIQTIKSAMIARDRSTSVMLDQVLE